MCFTKKAVSVKVYPLKSSPLPFATRVCLTLLFCYVMMLNHYSHYKKNSFQINSSSSSGSGLQPVWPDVEIKSSPSFSKSSLNKFDLKSNGFHNCPKATKHLGYFCKKKFAERFQKSHNLVTLLATQHMQNIISNVFALAETVSSVLKQKCKMIYSVQKSFVFRILLFLTTIVFFKKWPTPASFSFIFGLFKQTIQFLPQMYVKNVHPVYSAGIQTHDLQNITLFP